MTTAHDVEVRSSTTPIHMNLTNFKGERFNLLVEPRNALIDGRGVVRAFSVVYSDGFIGDYKLLPIDSTPEQVATAIAAYLGGLGLAIYGGRVVKGKTPVENIVRYTIFGFAGNAIIRSFLHEHVHSGRHGYFNVMTNKMIFPGTITAPRGSY
jgi:hypothetical protein